MKEIIDILPNMDCNNPSMELQERQRHTQTLEKQFKELTKERPDPDLQNGLGSIVYKLNKD